MGVVDLSMSLTQAAFGRLVGISQPAVSDFVKVAALGPGVSAGDMLLAYCERLREQAAGRLGETMGLDLVQERAALAREQRECQAIKNAVARKEYAPVGLLADVLGQASSAVVDRFDQLEGALRKSCPDLPDEAKTTVQQVIAAARNEWIRSTERLAIEAIAATPAEPDEDVDTEDPEGDAA